MRLIYILLPSLISFLLLNSGVCTAQGFGGWEYEEVVFPEGSSKTYLVSYDTYNEWLYFKNEEGDVEYFTANDLVSFSYMDSRYYSVPLNSGILSFFRVEFEGKKMAVLSKSGSVNLMHFLAEKYNKIYTLCGSVNGNKHTQLCEIHYEGGNEYSLFQRNLYPVDITNCLFILDENGLKPFQLAFEKRIFGIYTANRNFYFNTLSSITGKDNHHLVRKYARDNKLKEKKQDDLIMLIKYFDTL